LAHRPASVASTYVEIIDALRQDGAYPQAYIEAVVAHRRRGSDQQRRPPPARLRLPACATRAWTLALALDGPYSEQVRDLKT